MKHLVSRLLETKFVTVKKKLFNGVIVLYGGDSSEREASLLTGKNVYQALTESGIKTKLIDTSKITPVKLIGQLSKSSLVFNALHGGKGEDGTIQGFLDFCHIPYTGCDLESSSLGKNKLTCKIIWDSVGVVTPKYIVWGKANVVEFVNECSLYLNWPFVIKVPNEGSGQGVFLAKTKHEAINILNKLHKTKGIFAEKYIEGKEIATIVVKDGNNIIVSPVLEEKNINTFMDKSVKDSQAIVRTIPAKLSPKATKDIQQQSQKAFEILNCRDYARFDIRLGQDNIPYFLEITTQPSIKNTSRLPVIFQAQGLNLYQTIQYLVYLAVERQNIN